MFFQILMQVTSFALPLAWMALFFALSTEEASASCSMLISPSPQDLSLISTELPKKYNFLVSVQLSPCLVKPQLSGELAEVQTPGPSPALPNPSPQISTSLWSRRSVSSVTRVMLTVSYTHAATCACASSVLSSNGLELENVHFVGLPSGMSSGRTELDPSMTSDCLDKA